MLQIEPGAFHRSAAHQARDLVLIEVETPKDKFDLLRIEDDYRPVSEPYESEQHAPLRLIESDVSAPLALQPLVEHRLRTDRRARLRAPFSTGRLRFALHRGDRVRGLVDLVFAIALPRGPTQARELLVLDAGGAANAPGRHDVLDDQSTPRGDLADSICVLSSSC